jgi:hypothetical protein
MRFASKLMLLALLALPMGSVFAAAQDTLTVNITVTLATVVNVEFADGATGTNITKSWDILLAGLGSSHDSFIEGTKTQIQNNGPFQVDVTVKVTGPSSLNWSVGAVGTDKYQISAVDGATIVLNNAPSVTSITVPPLVGATPGKSDAAAKLVLVLPASVTHTTPGAGALGTIVVTYVAGATP